MEMISSSDMRIIFKLCHSLFVLVESETEMHLEASKSMGDNGGLSVSCTA